MGRELRDSLTRLGATRLQVNISDEAVANAMRITHYERPIEAVVSVAGGEARDIVDALGTVAGTVAAWEVTRRAPLDPTLPTDVRIDALANIAFLRHPVELTYDQWRQRWLDDHTQVAIDTQATFGYYQNVVSKPLTDNAFGVDAIVEELFPSAAVDDIHAFYGSGGDKRELNARVTAMMASVARIGADRNLDLVPTSRYDFVLG
nr:EthD domain-containing protein [Gordonia effusa]